MKIAATLLALLLCTPVAAQEGVFPVERHRPAFERDAILEVESASVPAHLQYDLGLWLGYANAPYPGLVDHRTQANLTAALGLFDWMHIGFDLPMILNQSRDDPARDRLTAFGLGDFRIAPKVRLLGRTDELIDLAFVTTLTLPSNFPKGRFLGENSDALGGYSLTPEIVFGSRLADEWRFGLNLGYRLRGTSTDSTTTVGPELIYKGGIAWRLQERFDLPLEVAASLGGEFALPGESHDLEGMFGTTWDFGRVQLITLVGTGFSRGHAAPGVRFTVGARYAPRFFDRDHDTIEDANDNCPDALEDLDGYQDRDGCPDPDNDGDGVLDIDDACRDAAEDIDDFQDADGCPDADNDEDGVDDLDDRCRDDPEDLDGHLDDDGCPDPDNDLDGVLDPLDKCPLAPGSADNGGCPWPDTDGDGVNDGYDACVDVAGTALFLGCEVAARRAGDKVEILGVLTLEGALFSTSSAPTLEALVALFTQDPALRVRVVGGAIAKALVAHLLAAGVAVERVALSERDEQLEVRVE